jgi:hypothetical protein
MENGSKKGVMWEKFLVFLLLLEKMKGVMGEYG